MPLSALSITVPSLEDAARDLEVEGSLVAGERVALSLRLPASAGIGAAEANAGALRVRVLSQECERDLAALVGDEPWTQAAQGGALLATLDLATVQAVGAFGPLPPPDAAPPRRMWPFPPPPPRPDAISVRLVVEYARGTGDATMLGFRAMRLLRWPGRGRENTTLLDLATGRVYSTEEVDNLVQGAKNYTDGQVSSVTARLTEKADLVGGKVPASQLPKMPVGPHGHNASDVSGLAAVATSGSYADLTNKPESVPPSTDDSATGKFADAKATGEALSRKQSALTQAQLNNIADIPNKAAKADATLSPIYEGGHTEPFSGWSFNKPATTVIGSFVFNDSSDKWVIAFGDQEDPYHYDGQVSGTPNDTEVVFDYSEGIGVVITATRTAYALTSYRLGPSGGPNADKPLATAAQGAKADAAYQKPSGGILATDMASAVQTSLQKADDALSRDEAEAGFTEWKCEPATYNGHQITVVPQRDVVGEGVVYMARANGETIGLYDVGSGYETSLSFDDVQGLGLEITATRTRLPTMADLTSKQDTISDLSTIRSGAAAGATAYQKPASGIPASDLAPGVIPAGRALVFATFDSSFGLSFTFNGVKYKAAVLSNYSTRLAVGPPGSISFNFDGYRSDSKIFLNGVEINTTPTSLAAGDCCEVWFFTCLALDTSILMSDGTDKTLEKICVGDMLKTPFGPDMVVGVSCGMGDAVDKWLFDDGTEVRTIGRHRFWNDEIGEPVYLEAWKLGEHAIKPDGSRVALVGHDHFEIAYPHKTLVTKNYNLYYANALLAGNRKSVRNGGPLP